MALSDLTVSGLEYYGGIDLKKNYRKYFSEGILISIGLHVLVVMLYVAYHFLTVEPHYIYPIWRTNTWLITVPPASIMDNDPLPPATTVSARPAALHDIPVPVPRLIEPIEVAPDPIETSGIPGVITDYNRPTIANPPLIQIPEKKLSSTMPEKGIWVDLSEEAHPINDVQSLVQYPANARQTGIEGRVTLSALIGEDGRVMRVDVEKADHPWLERAAIEAMMKMRFTPARQGEEAVKSWYTQTIEFKLNN